MVFKTPKGITTREKPKNFKRAYGRPDRSFSYIFKACKTANFANEEVFDVILEVIKKETIDNQRIGNHDETDCDIRIYL